MPSIPSRISIRSNVWLSTPAELAVIGVWASPTGNLKSVNQNVAFQEADQALGGALMKLVEREDFRGKKGQSLRIPTLDQLKVETLVLLGLGEPSTLTDAEVRALSARAAKAAKEAKVRTLVIALPDGLETQLRFVAEGLTLGAYRYTRYLTGDRKPQASLKQVTLLTAAAPPKQARAQFDLGERIGAAVNLARDLSNAPPNDLPPSELAKAAEAVATAHGLTASTFNLKEIRRRGMRLIEAVGQGSAHEPRMVHLSYVPGKGRAHKRLCFVGKGITFDTGGISIKPAERMGDMKHDMSGAGNMVGLMAAVAALKPNVEVHAILACAENMPDGNAYRPGDVWPSLDGKTVEIVNTDAEGRLVLADALAYARTLKPDLLVDNATLTFAWALGNTCSQFYATNDETASEFAAAAKQAGEQVWRMPLLEELKEELKSDIADIKHLGQRFGGSISAALFLREFIGEVKNWVHADITGPAMADRTTAWSPKEGATGHGVLTYLALVERALHS